MGAADSKYKGPSGFTGRSFLFEGGGLGFCEIPIARVGKLEYNGPIGI